MYNRRTRRHTHIAYIWRENMYATLQYISRCVCGFCCVWPDWSDFSSDQDPSYHTHVQSTNDRYMDRHTTTLYRVFIVHHMLRVHINIHHHTYTHIWCPPHVEGEDARESNNQIALITALRTCYPRLRRERTERRRYNCGDNKENIYYTDKEHITQINAVALLHICCCMAICITYCGFTIFARRSVL